MCPSLSLGTLLARGPLTGLQLHVRPDMRFLWRNMRRNLRKCFLEPHTAGGSGSLQLLWRLRIPRWRPDTGPRGVCGRGQGARMGAPGSAPACSLLSAQGHAATCPCRPSPEVPWGQSHARQEHLGFLLGARHAKCCRWTPRPSATSQPAQCPCGFFARPSKCPSAGDSSLWEADAHGSTFSANRTQLMAEGWPQCH